MADISKIKTLDGTTYDIKDSVARDGKVSSGIMEILNPFAPEQSQKLYIDRLENALYFADKRWIVTGTVTSSTGATTDLSASQIANLFDMGEENMSIPPAGGTLVLTIDFTGNDGTAVFPNYPYGILCMDFYYTAGPQSVSARVYGKHTGSTSFWQTLTVTADPQNTTSQIRYRANQTGMYNMQKLEITVVAKSDSAASLSDVSYYLTRANKDKDMPYVSKLRSENLYYPLSAPSFVGPLTGNASTATKATQDESGNNIKASYASSISISDHTITLKNKNGASLGTVTVPDNNTTYSANTSKLVTTTVPNVTSVGSAPTLGTAIPADDITSWTTNTPTAFSVSGEKLIITSGTAATLSYTAKSIPNVTSVGSAPTLGTAITVATGSLASNGSGGTVATGITAS